MTTPSTEFTMPWAVLRPTATGAGTLTIRSSGGVTTSAGYKVKIPQGITTVMVTWSGRGGINIQLRDQADQLYRNTIIPPSTETSQRMAIVEAPVEDPAGHFLVITGYSMIQDDVDKARAGVKLILSSM